MELEDFLIKDCDTFTMQMRDELMEKYEDECDNMSEEECVFIISGISNQMDLLKNRKDARHVYEFYDALLTKLCHRLRQFK